jgi:tRNA(Ile)-lysidine synthase
MGNAAGAAVRVPLTAFGRGDDPVSAAEFSALLAPLGPFEPAPRLAVAVSGGADSMALALLASDWARGRGGHVTALVVDHGLRRGSDAEAALVCDRLGQRGIPAGLLTLRGVARGPALAERARDARYAALDTACAGSGILHLLLGHHAGDQAETVAMRMLDRSGPAGLAGMAALRETPMVRRLRPLLSISPGRLRASLRAAGVAWVEDPSNADPVALRARLRALRGDAAGDGVATRAANEAAALRGRQRAAAERLVAAELAARVRIHPEGYAVLLPGPIDPAALAALLRMLAGARYPPALHQVEPLAAAPRAATLGGVRVMPAGRVQPGAWLLVREAAAMASGVPARPGAVWDGRFRLAGRAEPPEGAMLGPLGDATAALRRASPLPAAVLRTLPALRVHGNLFAVPHLRYPDNERNTVSALVFDPVAPAAGAPFAPVRGDVVR